MASAMTIMELTNNVARDVEVLGAPFVKLGEARQIGRQFRGDEPDFGANGVAQHGDTAGALPADEAPVLTPLGHTRNQNFDGRLDHPVRVEPASARAAQHVAQRSKRFVDQDQSQRFHRLEVPIKRRGHDAGLPRHFTQTQTAEAMVAEELQRRCHNGPPGRLFALHPGGTFSGAVVAYPV